MPRQLDYDDTRMAIRNMNKAALLRFALALLADERVSYDSLENALNKAETGI